MGAVLALLVPWPAPVVAGEPEVFVRPRGTGPAEISALLADGRIDAAESRTPAAGAIFAALVAAAPEQTLCRAATGTGGRNFVLRVTVLPPAGSAAAPASYNHPIEVGPSTGGGALQLRLANPGSPAPIAIFRCTG